MLISIDTDGNGHNWITIKDPSPAMLIWLASKQITKDECGAYHIPRIENNEVSERIRLITTLNNSNADIFNNITASIQQH